MLYKSLRTLFALVVVGAFILTAYLVNDYHHYKSEREAQSLRHGEEAGLKVATQLDAVLQGIAERAELYATSVSGILQPEALLSSIRKESELNPLVLGVTVAFEPGQFAGKERYAPFYNKAKGEFQFVEETYDYTDSSLSTAQWYTDVVSAGKSRWSEPYYAEAAQAMVVDYGVPLLNEQGEVIGIVDYTLTLSDFARIVDSLSVGEAGYGFVYSAEGLILSHPNPELLLDSVLVLRDGKDEDTLAKLRDGSDGVVAYNSTYTYKYSWFFFRVLPSTGWKSVLVFAEDDLLGASDEGRRKIIHIGLGIGVLLISLMLLPFYRADDKARNLWWLVAGISMVVISNIVLIWYLNLTTDFSQLRNQQERIVNDSILQRYVEKYDEELYRLTQQRYHKVPTGVFIESYELTSFEASLIGKLWMKYPKDLYQKAPPAFYFPDVSALETRGLSSEIISQVEHEDYVLVTWKFRVTLEQDFTYQQFPFEQNDIEFVMLYPDYSKNILFVPDLESYDILDPSTKPGLRQDIKAPSSEAISSYFSFKEVDYKTTFGNANAVQHYPALTFDIGVKRVYLSPFIANIIPIVIVALIMFIVLYISSSKNDERAGMTTMNVVQSAAGFLFILVLAHVNERNRIETPEIAYIELFYFSMYVFITLELIALAMLFRGVQWRLFTYQDNLVLKLLFWPVLLVIWLGVTLLRFY